MLTFGDVVQTTSSAIHVITVDGIGSNTNPTGQWNSADKIRLSSGSMTKASTVAGSTGTATIDPSGIASFISTADKNSLAAEILAVEKALHSSVQGTSPAGTSKAAMFSDIAGGTGTYLVIAGPGTSPNYNDLVLNLTGIAPALSFHITNGGIDGVGVASVSGTTGIDTLSLSTSHWISVSAYETLLGSTSTDTVTLLSSMSLSVSTVESLIGSSGTDTIKMLTPNNMVISGIESVIGSSGIDTVTMLVAGNLTVTAVETILGSSSNDTVTLLSSMAVAISAIETLIGGIATDTVKMLAAGAIKISAVETLFGSTGTDTVSFLDSRPVAVSNIESLLGSARIDTITLLYPSSVFVSGIETLVGANATETVTMLSSSVTVSNIATVIGASNNDVITVTSAHVTVKGGGGDDVIYLPNTDNSYATILIAQSDVTPHYITLNGIGVNTNAIGVWNSGDKISIEGGQISKADAIVPNGLTINQGIVNFNSTNTNLTTEIMAVESALHSQNASTGTAAMFNDTAGGSGTYLVIAGQGMTTSNDTVIKLTDVTSPVLSFHITNGSIDGASSIAFNSLIGTAGIDIKTLPSAGFWSISSIETLLGSSGVDTVTMLDTSGLNELYASGIETLIGSVGNTGLDRIYLLGSNTLSISNIDRVTGSSGVDTITMLASGNLSISAIDTLWGSTGIDTVTMLETSGLNVLFASGIETLMGSAGSNGVDRVRLLGASMLAVSGINRVVGSSGTDTVSLLAPATITISNIETLIGETGIDTVKLINAAAMSISNIETVTGASGIETITMLKSNNVSILSIETIKGSNGTDTVNLLASGYIFTSGIETLIGSSGIDTLALLSASAIAVAGVESVIGANGADVVTLITSSSITVSNIATIIGSTGNDTINVNSASVTIKGHGGDDVITLKSSANAYQTVLIDQGDGTQATQSTAHFITINGIGSATSGGVWASADIIAFNNQSITKAATVTGSIGTASINGSTGIASFSAADNTLAQEIMSVEKALHSTLIVGSAAVFNDAAEGTGTYLVIAGQGTATSNADVVIKLTGVATPTAGVHLTGGFIDGIS